MPLPTSPTLSQNSASTVARPSGAAQDDLSRRQEGRSHICLVLSNGQSVAIATDCIQEVLVVPAQRLTVMPNMARAVVGLLNHRGRVIWVVDLSDIFALPPLDLRASEYHLAILQTATLSLGIAVRQIKGVIRLDPHQIESPLSQELPTAIVPYLQGCLRQPPLLILDAEAIAAHQPA